MRHFLKIQIINKHNGRHPNVYIEEVNKRLFAAEAIGGKQGVLGELKTIGQEFQQAPRTTLWKDVL